MIETKSWKIVANRENEFVKAWEKFGWTLKSSSEYEVGYERAVKLTFTRDTEMPNYSRLRELGEIYEGVVFSEPINYSKFLAACLTLCWILPGVIYICTMKKKWKKYNERMEKIGKPALEEATALMQNA